LNHPTALLFYSGSAGTKNKKGQICPFEVSKLEFDRTLQVSLTFFFPKQALKYTVFINIQIKRGQKCQAILFLGENFKKGQIATQALLIRCDLYGE